MKGCFGKRAQDPGSRPCTKHFVGQSDPMTLFLWTWIWTSEWSSSKIQSLKHSPGFLTSPTASETSIASGNNGKQIRNKIRTQKPMVLYINKKGQNRKSGCIARCGGKYSYRTLVFQLKTCTREPGSLHLPLQSRSPPFSAWFPAPASWPCRTQQPLSQASASSRQIMGWRRVGVPLLGWACPRPLRAQRQEHLPIVEGPCFKILCGFLKPAHTSENNP